MSSAKPIARYGVSDEFWAKVEPWIPKHVNPQPDGRGRPRRSDRDCFNAIVFVLRTGCQWNALNYTQISPSSTAHDRFQEWVAADFFHRLWEAGLMEYDEFKGINWSWLSMDGAITKAPLGGEKTGSNPTDRGKTGVKRSLLTEASGIPVSVAIDGANRHDMKLVKETLDGIVVERPKPNEYHRQGMCMDKGYDYDEIRELVEEYGYTAHIRSRGEEAEKCRATAGKRARRWVVERTHSWMNRNRRILIRWEKKAANYLAMLHLACAIIAFQQAGSFS